MEQNIQIIAQELGLKSEQVAKSIQLLEEGNTIPFIARYRKEQTGELDEEKLREISERFQYLTQLSNRKAEIIRLIEKQGKLTDSLREQINQATKLQELEDLYLPYRPKRKTRATIARQKGLEPLAKQIKIEPSAEKLKESAASYINPEKEIANEEEALTGAIDIVAEEIAEDAKLRGWIREYTWKNGVLESKAKDPEERSVYEMYYDYRELVHRMPSHRVLAVFRGEREKVLKVQIVVNEEPILQEIREKFTPNSNEYLLKAIAEAYKRLIAPSIERETRARMMEAAEEQAIRVFSKNLRNLLLQPPIRGKRVLGIDPAYRTGCKLAIVDETGKLLHIDVIYPTPPQEKKREAKEKVKQYIEAFSIDMIAIGNGTASRETEAFVAETVQELDQTVYYVIVNEAGASVYSASKLAREEFPQLDVAERSAVSIARRLQDPLAELVKIDPKSVGVGQYQHDVSQKRLNESLQAVVESVVNYVGVDLNTASVELLTYVSGINSTVAKNIVKRREEIGRFLSRDQLKEVPRLGAKTYEQSVGFLRIHNGQNPLDQTPIHPESYDVVKRMFSELRLDETQLGSKTFQETLKGLEIERLAERIDCGVPTLKDIVEALLRPGRDPRDELPAPLLREDVLQIEDLTPGMHLKGTVRNVVDFGAFVDIGLKNDGLVHISKMSHQYVKDPLDVVAVGDIVDVWVVEVDPLRERVGLSMIELGEERKTS